MEIGNIPKELKSLTRLISKQSFEHTTRVLLLNCTKMGEMRGKKKINCIVKLKKKNL